MTRRSEHFSHCKEGASKGTFAKTLSLAAFYQLSLEFCKCITYFARMLVAKGFF
jgi:hypothetical protein